MSGRITQGGREDTWECFNQTWSSSSSSSSGEMGLCITFTLVYLSKVVGFFSSGACFCFFVCTYTTTLDFLHWSWLFFYDSSTSTLTLGDQLLYIDPPPTPPLSSEAKPEAHAVGYYIRHIEFKDNMVPLWLFPTLPLMVITSFHTALCSLFVPPPCKRELEGTAGCLAVRCWVRGGASSGCKGVCRRWGGVVFRGKHFYSVIP